MDEKWKQVGKDDLHRLYWDECLSAKEIADRYGLKGDEAVRKKMVRLGIARRTVGQPREVNIDPDELRELYQQHSMKKIARLLDVGETLIWKRLKEYGIKLRNHEDGGHRKKPGRQFSEEHRRALSKAHRERRAKGEKNPNWKGGVAALNWKARQTPEYRDWRAAALVRAAERCEGCGVLQGSECACCGTRIRLHVHHLKSFAKFPDLRFDPTNSEVVCPRCHRQRHNGKSGELLGTPNGSSRGQSAAEPET